MERIRAEPFVVRTRSVIVLSRLVDRADALAPLRWGRPLNRIIANPSLGRALTSYSRAHVGV